MKRVLLVFLLVAAGVLAFVFVYRGPHQITGNINDGRFIDSTRYLLIKGTPFPDYAKFNGWIGRSLEVTPVYKQEDKSWLAFEIYYIDRFTGATTESGKEKKHLLEHVGFSVIRDIERYLICVASAEKDGKLGIAYRFYQDGYLRGSGEDVVVDGHKARFLPFPEWANSRSYGFSLDEPLKDKIPYDTPIPVLRLALDRKGEKGGIESCGERIFYMQWSINKNGFEKP